MLKPNINITVPGLDKLLERLDQLKGQTLAQALELAFWSGVERGAVWGFIAGVTVTITLYLLWKNTKRMP